MELKHEMSPRPVTISSVTSVALPSQRTIDGEDGSHCFRFFVIHLVLEVLVKTVFMLKIILDWRCCRTRNASTPVPPPPTAPNTNPANAFRNGAYVTTYGERVHILPDCPAIRDSKTRFLSHCGICTRRHEEQSG